MLSTRIVAWYKWATFDEKTGTINGLREDAPEEARKAYEEDMAEEKDFRGTWA